MKRLFKGLSYLVVMLTLLVLFLPKINLYYAAEKLMQKKNVYISDEVTYDNGFSLELLDAKVFFDKLELMKVDNINFFPWIIYNSIELENIEVNEGFSEFLPSYIKTVHIKYTLYNPMKISLKGSSEDSVFKGDVNLIERKVLIHLEVGIKSEKKYKGLLRKLRKVKGGYDYEYKF